MRTTSPAIQSSPAWTPYSTPRVAMSCMPTQMPRNGLPRSITSRCSDLDHARHAVEAGAAVGEGADARQHDAVGRGDLARVGGDQHARRRVPASRAARSKALAAERRLPEP